MYVSLWRETSVAAIRENRQYIGIEKDEHFFDIAKKRIENELQQPKSLF
jgi:DNA modification methylase